LPIIFGIIARNGKRLPNAYIPPKNQAILKKKLHICVFGNIVEYIEIFI